MRLLASILRYASSIALLIVFWWTSTKIMGIPPYILPPPEEVVATLYRDSGLFGSAMLATVSNALLGSVLGIVGAIITGVLMGFWRKARWVGEPYLVVFQSFPRESLFPLLIVWFGFGMESKVAAAVLLSYFPVALLVLHAVTNTKEEYLELFHTWGGSRAQEFRHCRLPYAIPRITASVKIGLPLALIGAVIGEFLGSTNGLGYIIISSGAQFRVDRIFGAVTILALVGVAQFGFLQLIETTVLKKYFRNY